MNIKSEPTQIPSQSSEIATALTDKIIANFNKPYKNPLNLNMELLHPQIEDAIQSDIHQIIRRLLYLSPSLAKIYQELTIDKRNDFLHTLAGTFTTTKDPSMQSKSGFKATQLSKIYFDLLVSNVLGVYAETISAYLGLGLLGLAVAPITVGMLAISSCYPSEPTKAYYATAPRLKQELPENHHRNMVIYHFLHELAQHATGEQLNQLQKELKVLNLNTKLLGQIFGTSYRKMMTRIHFFAHSKENPQRLLHNVFPTLPLEIIKIISMELKLQDFMTIASLTKTSSTTPLTQETACMTPIFT